MQLPALWVLAGRSLEAEQVHSQDCYKGQTSGFLRRASGASTTGRAAAPAATMQQQEASRAMVGLMVTQLQLAVVELPYTCPGQLGATVGQHTV